MSKLVANVFKCIIVSVIIMMVGITITYIVLVTSIDNKIQAIKYAISNDIARNNYMTDTAHELTLDTFEDIIRDYTGDNITIRRENNGVYIDGGLGGSTLDNILQAITINYDELAQVKSYGDIHSIRINVYVRKIAFVSTETIASGNYNMNDYETRKVEATRPITYADSIPCYRYIK